ncbi:MAG: radical SAM protein [Thermodesulfovibrionales bacterium]|nr:radical SAM protein [Thermodesulfovibrionales bacterium]
MNAKKISLALVVIPTIENAYHSLQDFVAINPPIGLASVAATAEKAGYEVSIIDGDAEQLTLDQTVQRIVDLSPDYVGSTVMTATMDITQIFYEKLKAKLPNITVIVGGPHVSALPEQTLRDSQKIDISVIGEGDETIVDILGALDRNADLKNVAGIAYRNNGQITITGTRLPIKDLSVLPLPAFHLLNYTLYRSYGWNKWVNGYRKPLGIIFTGRGCIGKCNFCAAHSVFGHGIRYFTIRQIKDQLDYLVNNWGIRVLYFQDDTFTANRKIVNEICDYIIEKGYNKRLEIMVSSRVDTIHPPTLKKMREASVRWICFGVESGSQDILDRMNKHITIAQIKKAYALSREAGLFIAGNFMLGNLGETRETAMDTIRLACELDEEYASFAIAIPLPGTELYQYCLDNNIPLPAWNDFGSVNTPPIPLNESLSAEELMKLRDIAVNRFFKRPLYFLKLLTRMRAFSIIRDFVKMYFAIRAEKAAKRL